MNYSNNPYIYFDYDTEELVIEVENCSNANLLDQDEECKNVFQICDIFVLLHLSCTEPGVSRQYSVRFKVSVIS